MAKQYGLIVPNKSKLTAANTIKRPSIFNEVSDSEDEVGRPTNTRTNLKRQDRVTREKAVIEDPTVFQYDEVYDSIDQKRKDAKLSRQDLDKKPKYISKLLAAADKRKRENERRIERQVQREREAEGDEFKDKESFVTSAYRQKLEEFKKLEEEEKREEYLEAIGDVKRQGNLDGFYRHLYDQKVNYKDKSEDENKSKVKDKSNLKISEETKSDSDSNSEKSERSAIIKKKAVQKRKYRRREPSPSEEKDAEEDKKLGHLQSNLDADSDFSIDSDTEESDDESKPTKSKKEVEEKNEKEDVMAEKVDVKQIKEEDTNENYDKGNSNKSKKNEEKMVDQKPKKPKVDIWKKRTVGVVFDEAVQRYFERKALREASVN